MSKRKILLDFFIKTLNGMAYGLFATLIIGTILSTIAKCFPSDGEIYKVLFSCASCLQSLTGAGIGIGIALSLKFDSLKTILLRYNIHIKFTPLSRNTSMTFINLPIVQPSP